LQPREHLTGRHIERGEQIHRAMAHVVGPALGLADVPRQDRLRALQRLDLRFFGSTQETTALAGGAISFPAD
jgi:hypothetical protein